jgi:hypothetical protein
MGLEHYIPDVFKLIADKVASKQTCYFSYGHYADVIKELKQKDESISLKGNKYPLIWLVMDFTERKGKSIAEQCELPNLQLLIATPTDINQSVIDRINNNFKPILYPIYNELMLQIANSGYFTQSVVSKIEHDKIDRPYWGGGGNDGSNGSANLFNDYIDAIQIRSMTLNLKKRKASC